MNVIQFSRRVFDRDFRNQSRRARTVREDFEYLNLEDRRLLAANLELVQARLVDGNYNPIGATTLGERMRVEATWNTTDLPSNASYRIGFDVDGVQLPGGLTTAGAGIAVGNGYLWYRSGWFATTGLHSVTVTADIDNSVVEANESDNTLMFSFTPQTADIPVQLIWPMPGLPYEDYGVSNYTDIDPTSGIRDYRGGFSTYNGHDAIDSGPAGFQAMDAGVPILAAANGTVVATHDGEWDRQTDGFNQNPTPTANYIIIDHGAGWQTFYWHLRRDSLQVEVGDTVSQGDFIGYMGSSGISTGLHVHFGVTHHGMTVEPMIDQATYWVDPFGYNGDEVHVFSSGVTNYNPTAHGSEGPSQVTNWKQQPDQLTYVWAHFSGLRQNDFVQYVWHRPDDSVYTIGSFNVPQDYGWSWWWFSRTLPSSPDLGTWRVDFLVNGTKKGEQFFDVTATGAPEMRIEDLSTNLIVDDRYTPLDFGEVAQGSFDPSLTLKVINHGQDTLQLSNLRVPENYYVVEGLSTSVAPGGTEFFTIALDTSVAGYHAGEVRIDTNDADESEYDFSVEGTVVAEGQNQLTLGISERRVGEQTSLVANIRRSGLVSNPLSVMLTTNNSSEVLAPVSVTIPAGSNYVLFELLTLEDYEIDGDQVVEIVATAAGYTTAANELVVQDRTLIPLPFGVDFGPVDSPLYQDYFASDNNFAYAAEVGYGWLPDVVNANTFVNQRGDALTKDGVVLRSGTFVVDLPNRQYQVDVHLGIVKKTDRIAISIEGVADEFIPNPGPNVTRSYVTVVSDGQLSIYLDGLPGLNNLIRVSGITVTEVTTRPFANDVSKYSLIRGWAPQPAAGLGFDNEFDRQLAWPGRIVVDELPSQTGLVVANEEAGRLVIHERTDFAASRFESKVDPDLIRVSQLEDALAELLPI